MIGLKKKHQRKDWGKSILLTMKLHNNIYFRMNTPATQNILPTSFRWKVNLGLYLMIVFSHQEVIKMNCKFLSVPRRAFTWLDDTYLIVTSGDEHHPNGHCLALNTVSRFACCAIWSWVIVEARFNPKSNSYRVPQKLWTTRFLRSFKAFSNRSKFIAFKVFEVPCT